MDLLIQLPEDMGKQVKSLTNPNEFVRQAIGQALIMQKKQKKQAALLEMLHNFQPFQCPKDPVEIIRRDRQRAD